MKSMLIGLGTVATVILLLGLGIAFAPSGEKLPVERINEAFEAAASRPLHQYSLVNKGDVLVPTPIKTLTCTKRFCEPHRKGLDHLIPFPGNNQ